MQAPEIMNSMFCTGVSSKWPIIYASPQDKFIVAKSGELQSLRCVADSYSTVTWYSGHKFVPVVRRTKLDWLPAYNFTYPLSRMGQIQDGTLSFRQMFEPDDLGLYTCVVSTTTGTINASAYVLPSGIE